MSKQYDINDLIDVMAALRNPDGGCPWDLEQDFASIAPYTIEEAYEVAEAIDKGDMAELREELGDLLFQSVYHAQMADEDGHFNLHDVIHDITAKMISRHPHVFGDANAMSAEDVNAIWDERKKAEGKDGHKDNSASVLDGVPTALPALLRAQKLQKRAAKTGFEWREIGPVLDKLEEEIGELREALADKSRAEQEEELGDVLFVMANIGRVLDINPEEALRKCNQKFINRFKGLERDFKSQNKDMKAASLDELQAGWDTQKTKERT